MIGGAELVTLKWWKNLNRYTCIPDLLKLFPLKRGWIPDLCGWIIRHDGVVRVLACRRVVGSAFVCWPSLVSPEGR